METPLSIRRVTRSQTSNAINGIPMSRKKEESERVISRSRNGKYDRSALIDITNDSPIVGLAVGSLETPSTFAKNRDQMKQTPGSGEALLRGQVKTLLQKVEEEAELSKLSIDHHPCHIPQGISILAPTPANTPHISNLSFNDDDIDNLPIVVPMEEKEYSKTPQVTGVSKEETLDSGETLISRALLFDSPEKSEISQSSALSSAFTYEGSCQEKYLEEDDDSVWSIQANKSSQEEDEVEEEEEEDEEDYDEEEKADYFEEEDEAINELCDGLGKICVEEKRGIPQFRGKHIRFIYNSEDEIEGQEEIGGDFSDSILQNLILLKGMPMPQGKHLRFPEEEDD